MGKRRGGILAGIALGLTALFYGRALRFDLQCDDLAMIRPWSRTELAAVWHGSWDPSGVSAVFFRPIATWFYAGTFELFGFNAPAHMLLSLATLAALAWLLALFVTRDSGSFGAGVLAILLYLMHPNVPWSTGTWVLNDFHKLAAISALCALLLWQRMRHMTWRQWLVLAPFAIVCFLLKEDGLMLIPALVSIQWARAKLVGDARPPTFAFVASAGAFAIALFAWRYLALGELGGFGWHPAAVSVIPNLLRGPLYAFAWHGRLSALTVFEKLGAAVVAVLIASGIARMPRAERFLPVSGLLLIFWYGLPLALISNVTRYYMLTIASIVVVVPVFLSFVSAATRGRRVPALAASLLLLLLIMRTGAQARELNVFAPCGWAEQNCVSWVLDEVTMLPVGARAYIADTARACRTQAGLRPHIGTAGVLVWGLGELTIDTATGERSNVVRGDVVALIPSSAATMAIAVRHPQASRAHPVRIELTANGRMFSTELVTPDWQTIEVGLTRGWRVWLRDAHRIDAKFSAPGVQWKLLR